MEGLPKFSQVHVVSDLHMGGRPGFQILKETKRLANFIRWVTKQESKSDVALVLNGDVIDTLAEDELGYVQAEGATRVVQRIMEDSHFVMVWDALTEFVSTNRRQLVIVIGNHDIELAFPAVQRLVVERLCGPDLKARSRVEFSTMGAGYSCVVGSSRIFCTHGNEVDSWNFNCYEALSKVARRLNAGVGLVTDNWEPNAGTRMVKDIMNEVKRRYAWVDLLKPENSVAVGTLVALDPGQLSKITKLMPLLGKQAADGVFEVDQRLSVDSKADGGVRRQFTVSELLGPNMRSLMNAPEDDTDALLMALEERRQFGAKSVSGRDGTLGWRQMVWDRATSIFTNKPPEESLRMALIDWLKEDRSFDLKDEDSTYNEVIKRLGRDVAFVVTGHTHLERAIEMGGGRYYFNTGTWIRLMSMKSQWLKDRASFMPVFEVLKLGTMDALDKGLSAEEPLLLDRTSVVSFEVKDGQTWGRLCHVVGEGTAPPVEIKAYGRP